MRIDSIAKFLGIAVISISLWLLVPLAWSLAARDDAGLTLLQSLVVGLAAGAAMLVAAWRAEISDMSIREAIASVALTWAAASAIGALPYWLHGSVPTYVDAYFEAMSGFTTTGATVLADIESTPRSILVWRNLTQWLGGMGIIVLALAILPMSGSSMSLYRAEVPGPIHERLTPRIQQTAIILWGIYLIMSAAILLLLLMGGLSFFDALTLSFSTVATGGFSPYKTNVGHFGSVYVEWVVAIFLFMGGMNFTLFYLALAGKSLRPILHDAEFRFYAGLTAALALLVGVTLFARGHVDSLFKGLRLGLFQVVSMASSTGFFIDDYASWPWAAQFPLLVLMFIGGCAVSTSGGITQVRVMVVSKHAASEFTRMLHPRAIIPTRVGERALDPSVVSACCAFFSVYIFLFALGFILVTSQGVDLITAFSGVAATLGNVGPGLGIVGPADSFAQQPTPVKCVYSFLMLSGRLELFTVLALFSPAFWQMRYVRRG